MAKEEIVGAKGHGAHPRADQSSPNVSDYINVANETYYQPGVSGPVPKTFPDGLSLLTSKGKPVFDYDASTGFYGAAFVTPQKQVIVGFEGTNFFTDNGQFTAAQVIDDANIYGGTNAPSYQTSLQFTRTAIKDAAAQGIGRSNVFLAGHSLGAADAEFVATKTGLAGTTFGTPGISTSIFGSKPSQLTNYVEFGDPVGNYANNADYPFPGPPLGPIVLNGTIQHYGGQSLLGNQFPDQLPLVGAAAAFALNTEAGFAAAGTALAGALYFHQLQVYADSLHVTLGSTDRSLGGSLACFAQGTLIRTPRGDVAVEALSVGQSVVTASGAHRRIKWLGHRAVNCVDHPDARGVWPIRVAAHAFGAGKPERDLLLSPGHSVGVTVVDEVLIPIGALVNGSTIARVPVDSVTYWHVELDSHDILLADGLPAESYLEMENRVFFAEGGAMIDALPESAARRTHADFCRPFLQDGVVVDAVRATLAARAAAAGWTPDRAVDLRLLVDGAEVAGVLADGLAFFQFPADARDVRLMSRSFVPFDVTAACPDRRRLGVMLKAIALVDGLDAPQPVALDDPCLGTGFHEFETDAAGARRWTDGEAVLRSTLWAGFAACVSLHLAYEGALMTRGWIAPAPEPAASRETGTPRLVAVA